MRTFLFIESTEGGAFPFYINSIEEFSRLRGWMNQCCRLEDKRLIKWAKGARIGEIFCHRMGMAVRVRDDSVDLI